MNFSSFDRHYKEAEAPPRRHYVHCLGSNEHNHCGHKHGKIVNQCCTFGLTSSLRQCSRRTLLGCEVDRILSCFFFQARWLGLVQYLVRCT